MTKLLVKLFVKNCDRIEDASVRASYGMLSGLVGIFCNVFLFLAKMAAGLLTHSIAIMADACNNLSDAVSSVIGYVGSKMASKPADEHHPFGHGRIEYIAAFVVAFLVLQVGFSLLKSSVMKIFRPEAIEFHPVSVGILVMSVLVKLWLWALNGRLGKRIDSKVMQAVAADSLGDVCATGATLLSLLVYRFAGINADGYIGVLVSGFVLMAGCHIAKDTLAPLIGEPISPELYHQITEFVESYEGVTGSHDLIVHNYGPGRSMASIHAEVPRDVDIEVSHEIVDRIEHDIYHQMGIFLVVHMDPVDLKNQQVVHLKEEAQQVIEGLDSRLSLHDFRIVSGPTRTNLIFDLVVPGEYTAEMQRNLRCEVAKRMHERNAGWNCVITTEHSFVDE